MLTSYHYLGRHSFYVSIYLIYIYPYPPLILLSIHICSSWYRIQKDLVDPEKLQTTLRDGTLGETYDLNRALEMVAILEGIGTKYLCTMRESKNLILLPKSMMI